MSAMSVEGPEADASYHMASTIVMGVIGPSSLDDLKQGSKTDGDCGSNPRQLPSWIDIGRYRKVEWFFAEHAVSLTLAWHCSLVMGFSLPSLLTAVDFTQGSDTPKKALQRYMRTFAQLEKWHTGNIWDPSSAAFSSVEEVRNMHNTVRSHMKTHLPGTTWISMFDMAIVQTGFMGAISIIPKKFGLHATEQDLADYVFFWKCVGHQLGIDDCFNICSLGKSTSDQIVRQAISSVLLPDLANPPPQYSHTAEAYVKGLNLMMLGLPFFSVKSTNALSFWALGLQWGPLGILDTCRFFYLRFLLALVGCLVPVRHLVNWAISASVRQNRSFWEAQTPAIVCPFSGQARFAQNSADGSYQHAEGRLRMFTPIGMVLLAPLLLLLCIIGVALAAACRLQILLLVTLLSSMRFPTVLFHHVQHLWGAD